MIRKGSCHCGAVQFTAEFPDARLVASRCNCSICGRTGTLMTFVPASALEVTQGGELYVDYQFGKKSIHHGFCKVCGVRPYGSGVGGEGPMAMINVGCLEGVDVRDHADAMVYDGAAL